jgi:hypothetical protein
MGDRGNIKIISGFEEAPPLYFYTHWHGSDLPKIVVEAMKAAHFAARLDDESYANRIIFDVLTSRASDAHLGFGIASWPSSDADTTVTIDFKRRVVDFGEIEFAFEEVVYKSATIDAEEEA